MDESKISALELEALDAAILPHYGALRDTPDENGHWIELIGPDHPRYEEAQRAHKKYMKDFWVNASK